jgi:hypothetical protein
VLYLEEVIKTVLQIENVISTKPQLNLNHFTLDIPEYFIENG